VLLSTTEAISMEVSTTSKPIENEAFWKHHHQQQTSSGMKRSDYCREKNINYDRFGYWIRRCDRFNKDNDPIKLIDVKVKSTGSSSQAKILCILDLKNGCSLKIYDPEVLTIILERCD
jgi:hypothetical protein